MSEPEIVQLPNGQFVQNCWLVADPHTREAVMIDPGEEPAMFLAELDTRRWTLRAIWLTHGHIDHILGVAAVKRATGVPVFLHPADRSLYDRLADQGAWFGMRPDAPPAPDHELAAGQHLSVGSLAFEVRPRPRTRPSALWGTERLRRDALFTGRSAGLTLLAWTRHPMQPMEHEFLSLGRLTVVERSRPRNHDRGRTLD